MKAIPRKLFQLYNRGIWCVRLNVEPSARNYQPIAIGVDPGSKREGFTVKSKSHTYLNIQTHAVDWVKDHIEVRRNMRRARRFRKTPCRQNRKNRLANKLRLPPSTKARWQWKLRIVKWLVLMFPVSVVVVEDIKAKTRIGAKRWNGSFSPLEVGKRWFYSELERIAQIETRTGNDTYKIRQELGLKKSKQKLSNKFEAHCVDSWVLANWYVGGHLTPDNTTLLEIVPLEFHRRQLHRLQQAAGHVRSRYGGTLSAGFKRGSIVKHKKLGVGYVGGWKEAPTKKDPNRKAVSLHCLKTGKRLTQNAITTEIKFLSYNTWCAVKTAHQVFLSGLSYAEFPTTKVSYEGHLYFSWKYSETMYRLNLH